jgi:hypothetical protein
MAMTDWISVKDRLPEPWVTVLLWDGDEMVSGYANYDGDLIEHRWGQVFRATHWMLPEPPGEEVEGMNYYAFKNSQETEVLDFEVKNSIRKNSDNCEQGKPYPQE